MDGPVSRVLSSSQLALLADHGEERAAEVGETLFEIGDESYPFVAIVEGEVMVTDAAGQELVRHGASGFLGEMNLLSGQTVFLNAVVTEPMRYIAVDREVLRQLLFEDGALSDLLLSAFVERREMLQRQQGVGFEIIGPRDSPQTRRLLDFARIQRLPHSWIDPAQSAEPRRPGRHVRRRRHARRPSAWGRSCGTPATASSPGRWASDASSHHMRRWTC